MRGERAAAARSRSALNTLGGFRNEVTFVLTGLDIEAKAALVRAQLEAALPATAAELSVRLARTDHADADTEEAASALLRVHGQGPGRRDGRPARSRSAAVELALASYPGFTLTTPPGDGRPYGVYAAGVRAAGEVAARRRAAGRHARWPSPPPRSTSRSADATPTGEPAAEPPADRGERARGALPLGRVAGARSGDKGGDANVGVWARDGRRPDAWLRRARSPPSAPGRCCRRRADAAGRACTRCRTCAR